VRKDIRYSKLSLLGLSLAAEMVKGERQVRSLTIGADSQATMRTIGHRRAIPGPAFSGGLP